MATCRRLTPILITCVVAASSIALAGQTATSRSLPPGLTSYDIVKVAEGIYAFIPPENNGGLVSGNSVAIIGDDGVLVVDSGHAPSTTARMIAQLKRWTDIPVRFLVNTHWHPDHNAGNGLYKEAYPGLQIVSTSATRAGIENEIPKKEVKEETIAQIRKVLSGDGGGGKPLDPAVRKYYETFVPQLEAFLPELRMANHALPTIVFDSQLTLYLGKREVQVMFLGRGNTGGDAVTYVPDSQILIAGDLLVWPVPYPYGSFFGEWIETLKKLKAMDATTIIPGHGPVMHDKQYLELVIGLLETTRSQAAEAFKRGLSAEQAIKAVDLSSFRKRFAGDNPERALVFDRGYIPAAVTRAYREAKEGPLHDEN